MGYLEAEWMRYWLDVYEGKYREQPESPVPVRVQIGVVSTGALEGSMVIDAQLHAELTPANLN